MAKITVTIEDIKDGKVKVVSEPTFETFMKMAESGHDWTAAHGYAMALLNHARYISKQNDPTNLIKIPGLKV